MKQKIQLFDVDGTLTKNEKDLPFHTVVYKTFAFWPLLSSLISTYPIAFEEAARLWNESMKQTPDRQKDQSSRDMMERTIQEFFPPYISAEYITKKAEEITQNFLIHDIVHIDAINYINECLTKGIICVLTTGSYLDGLQGLVNVLIAKGHLNASPNLLLNGVEIDWENKKLIRANVGAYKIENLYATLKEKNITDYVIQAAFGDDPYINDKGILEIVKSPHTAFVIKCKKNEHGGFHPSFIHCSWQEFIVQHKQRVLSWI
jgi:hypothetical protein